MNLQTKIKDIEQSRTFKHSDIFPLYFSSSHGETKHYARTSLY